VPQSIGKSSQSDSRRSLIDRRSAGVVAALTGSALLAAGTLMPWPATGTRTRNGYELASTLGALGRQLDIRSAQVVGAMWFAVPAAIGVTLLSMVAGRRWVDVLAALWGVGALAISLASIAASERVGLGARSQGPWTSAFGAGLMVVAHAMHATIRRSG
jgi:hypothetical protein